MSCAGCKDGLELRFDFEMAFQPIVDLHHARVWGYEALVRGPAGESAHSILSKLDEQTLYKFDQAARVKAIETAGRLFPSDDLILSINFLPNAVYEPVACIQKTLAAAHRVNFPRRNLMFEFTENERMVDPAHIKRIIQTYRSLGFRTALDDFGAGYAGLGLLTRIQADILKIDMELIRDIDTSDAKQAVIKGIAAMAEHLGIELLAEGIETAAELAYLRDVGIRLFQGYLFAKPGFMSLPVAQLKFAADRDVGLLASGF